MLEKNLKNIVGFEIEENYYDEETLLATSSLLCVSTIIELVYVILLIKSS